jgi:RNA polymerase sigma-70 factor (ECF subfamily)
MLVVAEREQLPMAAARAGSPEAWDTLFQRYQLPLYAYVFELIRSEQTALDVVQETFTNAARNLASLRDDDHFGGWLFSIAHRKCVDRWRKSGREEPLELEVADALPDEVANPSELLIRREQEVEFMNLIEQLPPRRRSVLLLHFMEDAYDPAKKSISPERVKANMKALEKEIASGRLGKTVNAVLHHQFIAALFLPALGKIPLKAATAQTATDQVALACALERSRFANGHHPETLAALAAKFVSQPPHDVVTGKPAIYRRSSDGQFQLYSIGWDGKDDGGKPGKRPFDDKEGDWVWSYPQDGRQ